jgi:predicted metal-binding protein
MNKQDYIEKALELGADDAIVINIEDIVFDERTILKCMFGCADWGKGCTCPSRANNLSLKEYREIFQKYKWGIIIHSTNKKKSQDISYELERTAFLEGYYFAFSLSDCACCKECMGLKDKNCANPKKARPAFHSVGIDVFKTVRKFHLPIKTLADENEVQNWYSAVFID